MSATGGALRVGIVQAPTAGVFFAAVDPHPRGVTVDLGAAFAAQLGRPVAYAIFPNSGECTEATATGDVEVAFMPVDAHRQTRVAFGPAYYLLESTYLVSAASNITNPAEIDQPHIRIVGIADTTTLRASTRTLNYTTPIATRGVDEALAMIREGRADALALSRDSLNQILPTLPGARILPGGFQQTTISIAVPLDRPDALAAATTFLQSAKRDGRVRRAFDRLGLQAEQVAP